MPDSLHEVGRVRAVSQSALNRSPAATTHVSGRTFADQSQFQVERVLDQTPGALILHPGSRSVRNVVALTIGSARPPQH